MEATAEGSVAAEEGLVEAEAREGSAGHRLGHLMTTKWNFHHLCQRFVAKSLYKTVSG